MSVIVSPPVDGAEVGYVHFDCPHKPNHSCYVPIRQGEQRGLSWNWDGNIQAPTIKPSIDCKQCGWHGFITKGVVE